MLSIIRSLPAFSWRSSEETVDFNERGGLWVNRYILDLSVCVQCKQRRRHSRLPPFTQRAHRLHCFYLSLTETSLVFCILDFLFVFTVKSATVSPFFYSEAGDRRSDGAEETLIIPVFTLSRHRRGGSGR